MFGIDVETCAGCAGLRRFTQRHRVNRVYLDAVDLMPGQGIGSPDGRLRRQCGRDEEGSKGRQEVSGENCSHAAGRAGAFFTGDWIAERMRTPFILPILLFEPDEGKTLNLTLDLSQSTGSLTSFIDLHQNNMESASITC